MKAQLELTIGYKRSTDFLVRVTIDSVIDPIELFTGHVRTVRRNRFFAMSPICGKELEVNERLILALFQVSDGAWVSEQKILKILGTSAEQLDVLCDHGLVLSQKREDHASRLRNRNNSLTKFRWDASAASYHMSSRWRNQMPGVSFRPESENDISFEGTVGQKIEEKYGIAPSAFHRCAAAVTQKELTVPEDSRPIHSILRRRRTTRFFDENRPMPLAHLESLLYYGFGCHGFRKISKRITLLKKFVPSGGALHPTEAYPIITNVEGIAPGVYHYCVENHALSLIKETSLAETKELIANITGGQHWYSSAHLAIVMTSRFDRLFWKYRNHKKAYKVALLDCAHISQSLYMLSTDLDLTAFVTTAINEHVFEELLGLDPLQESPLLVSGCGVPKETGFKFEFSYEKYFPRKTKV